MNYKFDPSARIALLQEWHSSEEFCQIRQQMHNQYIRLLHLSKQLFPSLDSFQRMAEENTVRLQYASGGTLHRGPYCPSPIYDYVVGNAKRGHILKRVSKNSRISHRFSFDKENRMLLCEQFSQGALVSSEYFIHTESYCHGFQIDPSGHLIGITEECYDEGQLTEYTYVQVQFLRSEYLCFNIHREEYDYDAIGLLTCRFEDCFPGASCYQRYDLEFERQDGYLTAYTAVDRSISIQDVADCYCHRYPLKGDRIAWFKTGSNT